MRGLRWEEWVIGLIGVWLVATPCLWSPSASEGLWNLLFTADVLLAGGALVVLGARWLLGPEPEESVGEV